MDETEIIANAYNVGDGVGLSFPRGVALPSTNSSPILGSDNRSSTSFLAQCRPQDACQEYEAYNASWSVTKFQPYPPGIDRPSPTDFGSSCETHTKAGSRSPPASASADQRGWTEPEADDMVIVGYTSSARTKLKPRSCRQSYLMGEKCSI